MPQYRAFPIGDDGHLLPAEIIEAESDSEAIRIVKTKLDGKPIEVWDHARLVARLERVRSEVYVSGFSGDGVGA